MKALPYKYIVATLFVAALFLDLLDMTAAGVALPAIAQDYGGAPTSLQWVVTGYLLALAVVTPASGWLGDRFGTKRVFLTALTLFTVASALCAVAWDLPSLVGFRVVQGMGGGLLTPVGMTMLLRAFPEQERATASAILAMPVAVAPALGPILGGYFVAYHSWHWVYLMNIPIGGLTLLLSGWLLQEHREAPAARFDWWGFGLGGTGLAALLYGLVQVGEAHGAVGPGLSLALLGAALLAGFVWVEERQAAPLLDLSLFGEAGFRTGNSVLFFASVGFSGVLLVLPLLLQIEQGLSAFEAGLVVAAHAVGILAVMPLAPRLYHWLGGRMLLAGGMAGGAGATLGFLAVGPATSPWLVGALMLANGVAFGLTIVVLQTAPFAGLPSAQLGRATALTSVVRQIALSLGGALFATVLGSRLAAHHATLGAATTQVGTFAAFHEVFLGAVLLSGMGTVLALSLPLKASQPPIQEAPKPIRLPRCLLGYEPSQMPCAHCVCRF
jgi:EmrB/QacA subfamily drug resistance transporter